jgi:hypothetical protein
MVAGLSADISGDVPALTLDSLRITMNKLRLVRAGGRHGENHGGRNHRSRHPLAGSPSGVISGCGEFRGDGEIEASFRATSVDLAALGWFGGGLPISGVLSSSIEAGGRPGDLDVSLHATIDGPTYGSGPRVTVSRWMQPCSRSDLTVEVGVWIWSQGIRSGVSFAMDSVWDGTELKHLHGETHGAGD